MDIEHLNGEKFPFHYLEVVVEVNGIVNVINLLLQYCSYPCILFLFFLRV